MMRVVMLAVVVALMISVTHAQEDRSRQPAPGSLAARLAADPQAVLAQAEEVLLGYGLDGRIDRDGIVRMIAINRAAVRARAVGQLLAADLDGNGGIEAAEAAATAAARSAASRARLLRLVSDADADGDGAVSPAELRSQAEAQALRAVSQTRERRLLDLLALDADGDGWLDLSEVRDGIAAAQAAVGKRLDEGA